MLGRAGLDGQRLPLAVAAGLAALTARTVSFHAEPGLDPSWQAALHMAARHGVRFGDAMVFTFGPLGFLSQPVVYFASTGALSALYVLALQVALCVALLSVLRRPFGLVPAAAMTYVAANASLALRVAEVVVVVVVIVAVALLREDVGPRAERVLVAAGGVMAGTHVLVKFNTGVTIALVGAVTAWFVGRRAWRSEAVFWGSAAVSLVGGWLLTGNGPGDLSRFLTRSAEVASGYSEAMGIEARDRAREYPLAGLVIVILVSLAWVASRGWPRGRRVGLGLVGAVWLYAALKHGFVHHDLHDIIFFGEGLLVATALASPGGNRAVPAVGLAVLLASFLVASSTGLVDLVNPLPSLRASATEAVDFALPGRRARALDAARADLQRFYGLTPATVALLEGHTVHVHPWEATVAWAYPAIRWRPLPVYQAYSAYTPSLDTLNARFLAGPSAPERILTEEQFIDFRNPDWESPAAVLAILCHYRELATQPGWQVLGRVPDRCGAEVPLGMVDTHVGQTVPVPDSSGRDLIVVARIRGLDDSPLYALRSALLKLPEVHVTLDGTRRHRLVPGTAADGLVVRTPTAVLGFSEPFAVAPAATLQVDHGGGLGLGSTLRIEFVGVPVIG